MSTATTADPDQPPLLPSSIPIIDLRLLSQSDLYSLSTSSLATSSSPNNRPDDVIIPKIDKTVFNESAGSRKQTYSRLRLAPPLSATSSPNANMRRRHSLKYAPVTLSSSNEVTVSESSNELAENSEIVSVLKGLFMSRSSLGDNYNGDGDVIVEEDAVTVKEVKEKESEVVESDVVMSPEPVTAVLPKEESTETKKKRGRPRKSESGNVDESAVLVSVSESVAKRAKAAEEEEKKRKSESGNVGESTVLVGVSESVAKQAKAAEEEEVVMSPEPVTVMLPEEEETKKKRGRPRKSEGGNGNGSEVLVSAASVAKRVRARARARESSVMKVVEDYDRDKDKEVVNSKGEKVDVVKLGELDDPYGPEIGRRTEGMSSVDELLEFFRGLNGQWGTTRKKRRVVDASEFGDCLPKGWRLSLCIKKKDGRVWVFCRRYIRFGFRFSYVYDILLDVDSYMDDVMFKASNDAICI